MPFGDLIAPLMPLTSLSHLLNAIWCSYSFWCTYAFMRVEHLVNKLNNRALIIFTKPKRSIQRLRIYLKEYGSKPWEHSQLDCILNAAKQNEKLQDRPQPYQEEVNLDLPIAQYTKMTPKGRQSRTSTDATFRGALCNRTIAAFLCSSR